MNTVLEIGSLLKESTADALFLEVGQTFCSLAFIDAANKSAQFIGAYTFDILDLEESVDAILKTVSDKQADLQNIVISPAFPEALLVPNKFYHNKTELLNSIYSRDHFFALNDAIAEWQVVNVYTVPVRLQEKLNKQLPDANYIHAYTPLLKIYNGFTADHQVSLHFFGNQFRVLVKKNHHVALIQTYTYASPMDVVYYLLKICSELQLPIEETQIIISGLIDEDSALYKELHHYFLHLHFATSATLALPEHQHPDHFFTSIHNLAACVL